MHWDIFQLSAFVPCTVLSDRSHLTILVCPFSQKCLQCPWFLLFIYLCLLFISSLFFFINSKIWGLLFLGPRTCSGFHGNIILQPPAVSFLILISSLLDAGKKWCGFGEATLQLRARAFNYFETACLVVSAVTLPGLRTQVIYDYFAISSH